MELLAVDLSSFSYSLLDCCGDGAMQDLADHLDFAPTLSFQMEVVDVLADRFTIPPLPRKDLSFFWPLLFATPSD